MFDKRISFFTGHYGSGKTEIAVNYAIKLSRQSSKTAIVDSDIVNPYFRTADAKDILEQNNIKVVLPLYANTNVDIPALPPEIYTLFRDKEYKVVFDVGGDDLGAKVVSRYNEEIVKEQYEMFYVVNTKRPMTDTEEKIEEMIFEIETSARLKITGIINNTNLLEGTTPEDIIEGHKLIEKVAKKLQVPVSFIAGIGDSVEEAGKRLGMKVLKMDKYILLPWDRQ
ncbi:hypothetical protein [Clostridium thermosuccinogenes]|jgi:MinD-like ATPase involved in chromosome partitioning or flagellar assembly|uniref:nucleotide-binding protein n=1 Tax=Clostridium thermosuccinogenes TaxID=84032 RepID=UPI000CCBED04|nr:hypothetical protein [Pseudoclostridium thermosuccinogenes]PNT92731.1 hypothetical protein CDQ83_03990 [Pseudoclostridium thermosuccinogenes]